MMSDPKFKEDMKKITETDKFKSAMNKAADDIEMLSKDPIMMKKLKAKADML